MDYDALRLKMVEDQIASRGIDDPRILAAFRKVPRHLFIEESMRGRAYGDYPLPIGDKQTISQPYTVAVMTQALELKGQEKILEVGTGSGYQTAILLELVDAVYSIERIDSLADQAEKLLKELGYSRFSIHLTDGSRGWPEEAPFNAILVAAGAPKIPKSLVDQLAPNGRLVIPVGDEYVQTMMRITKLKSGKIKEEDLGSFRFVGLIGEQGWKR